MQNSLPPAGAGLTNADLARLHSSLDSSVSDNTRAMNNSAWRAFETWAQARGPCRSLHPRPWWPPTWPTWPRSAASGWPPYGSTRQPWPPFTGPLATPIPPTTRV